MSKFEDKYQEALERIKEELDADKNGKVNLEDALEYFGTDVRKALYTGFIAGSVVGALFMYILK